jgi:lactate dehydrogenase-like 2-hydroxyacid dehydrogenase
MVKTRLVLTREMTAPVMKALAEEFDLLTLAEGQGTGAMLEALERHRAEALIFTSATPLTAGAIAAVPARLRIAASFGVGFDHVDVAAAQARGLVVTNTPDVLTASTADMAFLMILGACRRASEYAAILREGWGRSFGLAEMLGIEVSGKTVGILGMGRIGQAVAARARGFDMRVVYHNRSRLEPAQEAGAVYFDRLEDMLPVCDILSLHAPGGAGTAGLIDSRMLALLPRGAVLVNTSRGSLVEEEALLQALQSGQLFAAGLDVFRNEPFADPRFARLPNVFLAPHMGSATVETRTAMGMRCLENVRAVLAGLPPRDPIWT